MVDLGDGVVGGTEVQALGIDVGDRPCRAADLDDLAGFGQGGVPGALSLLITAHMASSVSPKCSANLATATATA